MCYCGQSCRCYAVFLGVFRPSLRLFKCVILQGVLYERNSCDCFFRLLWFEAPLHTMLANEFKHLAACSNGRPSIAGELRIPVVVI